MTINAYSRNNRIRFRYAQQLSDDGWNGTSHCRQIDVVEMWCSVLLLGLVTRLVTIRWQDLVLVLFVEKILRSTMIHSTRRSSTFHWKVEIGPTWFFMQLFIDKAGEHEKKLGGQFFESTFWYDKGGPEVQFIVYRRISKNTFFVPLYKKVQQFTIVQCCFLLFFSKLL